jgi:peptide-methionine (S)-S-oxide reductase
MSPHYVLKTNISAPFPEGNEQIIFGMGCFWGAERLFWDLEGVYSTAVGYAGGELVSPTYKQVCSGTTNHTEVVVINYNPKIIKSDFLLKIFLENHDPTQGNRQGNDIGSQYRSSIYTTTKNQFEMCNLKIKEYQNSLTNGGFGKITTELKKNVVFYYAEEYHQQYLAKNPNGYCGIKGTGIFC